MCRQFIDIANNLCYILGIIVYKAGGTKMNQSEKRKFLIEYLLNERPDYKSIIIPNDTEGQKNLLRSLMNVRMAAPIGEEFERVQNEYLREENNRRGVVTLDELTPIQDGIYIWRGDITRIKCGAIVNAANSGMTGCYQPCHNCIDNCIHTYAGIQLRNYCNDIMTRQGHPEHTGEAKLTPAFNLPCDYVIHTVGPIVQGRLSEKHKSLLASCYRSCLEIADKNSVKSIAFCCISTGVFMFPNDKAAEIAVKTVKNYRAESGSDIKVIFNVFKELDEQLYRKLLTDC
jgi:O-acetyl-ADP-ribose deacetylase (regulator of RNase III)